MSGQVCIRTAHRTMYFASREMAEKFLEDTKSWKIEEWTLDEEKSVDIEMNQMIEKLHGKGDLELKRIEIDKEIE